MRSRPFMQGLSKSLNVVFKGTFYPFALRQMKSLALHKLAFLLLTIITWLRLTVHSSDIKCHILTSSPQLKLGDSPRHREGFLFRRGVPGLAFTAPPQASNTVSPTAWMFFAALRSL